MQIKCPQNFAFYYISFNLDPYQFVLFNTIEMYEYNIE